jgi:hypothetical protein
MDAGSQRRARCHRGSLAKCALLGLLLALVLAAPAWASWGNGHCELGEGRHCYSITAWRMHDPPESVKGGLAFITTNDITVPEFANGSFVDDEMWVSFQSSGGWLEIGQTAGNGGVTPGQGDCCTLHPFIAHAEWCCNGKGEPVGYEEYLWWTVHAEPRNLYKIEDPAANGYWCEYIWENGVDCHSKPGHWPAYADDLEAGIEAASNSRPYNGGSQEVAAVARDGSHRSWTGSQTHAIEERDPSGVMCETPNWSSNYPGNADWWIC